MTWTPELVRIRFVEAAGTERFLSAPKVGTDSGYWPQFIRDAEDMKGWDDQAWLDNAERWKGRAPSGAISRHFECLQWTMSLIDDEKRRKLVWAFSFCRANKRDFGKLCERKGWIKSTSYDRLNKVWQRLSDQLCNSNLLLRPPSEFWVGHESDQNASLSVQQQTRVELPRVPTSVIYERSRDLIRTEQDAEIFAKHLAKHNHKARREQQRRETRLLKQIEAA